MLYYVLAHLPFSIFEMVVGTRSRSILPMMGFEGLIWDFVRHFLYFFPLYENEELVCIILSAEYECSTANSGLVGAGLSMLNPPHF